MQRTLGFLAGALTGALVGATISVLFAPAPGKTLREDVSGRFIELKDQMQAAAQERRAEMESQLESLRLNPPTES